MVRLLDQSAQIIGDGPRNVPRIVQLSRDEAVQLKLLLRESLSLVVRKTTCELLNLFVLERLTRFQPFTRRLTSLGLILDAERDDFIHHRVIKAAGIGQDVIDVGLAEQKLANAD